MLSCTLYKHIKVFNSSCMQDDACTGDSKWHGNDAKIWPCMLQAQRTNQRLTAHASYCMCNRTDSQSQIEVRYRIDIARVTYSNWTAPLKEATYFNENLIGTCSMGTCSQKVFRGNSPFTNRTSETSLGARTSIVELSMLPLNFISMRRDKKLPFSSRMLLEQNLHYVQNSACASHHGLLSFIRHGVPMYLRYCSTFI